VCRGQRWTSFRHLPTPGSSRRRRPYGACAYDDTTECLFSAGPVRVTGDATPLNTLPTHCSWYNFVDALHGGSFGAAEIGRE
jgi:hypothetical protein